MRDSNRNRLNAAADTIIERYNDNSMGMPVLLLNSAIQSSFEGEEGVIVPDLKGLEAAMAIARAARPEKLTGQEIRFLRKAMGQKAIELASFLDVAPETLSRWENDREVISTNPERIFRLRVLRSLKARAKGVDAKLDDVLDLKITPVRTSLEPVKLIFERKTLKPGGREVWTLKGVSASKLEANDRQVA